MTNGLQLSGTYSYSRATSIGDMEGGALMDPTDPERDWGPSPGDVRHTVCAQATSRRRSSAAPMRWLNGFQFSTLVFYNSGFPVNAHGGRRPQQRSGAERSRAVPRPQRVHRPGLLPGRPAAVAPHPLLARASSIELMVESENLLNRLNAVLQHRRLHRRRRQSRWRRGLRPHHRDAPGPLHPVRRAAAVLTETIA